VDPRQQKSRAALVAAAIELVDERDVAEISVTDLAGRAGLTRMTFYQHFPDRDSLLQAAGVARFEFVLDEFVQEEGQRKSLAEGSDLLLDHLSRHRIFYQRLLSGTAGLQTYQAIQSFLAQRIAFAASAEGVLLDEPRKVFLGGGAMALISRWLDDDAALILPPATAASATAELIAGFIRASR
jgi:AcrR family transcriptional regulator